MRNVGASPAWIVGAAVLATLGAMAADDELFGAPPMTPPVLPAAAPAPAQVPDESAAPKQPDIPVTVATPTGTGGAQIRYLTNTNLISRNPFWPIGYVPPVTAPMSTEAVLTRTNQMAAPVVPVAVKPLIQWPTLKVRGTTRASGGRQMALIVGVDGTGLVEKGAVIQTQRDGVLYRWRIVGIDGKIVDFERLDAVPVAAAEVGGGQKPAVKGGTRADGE